MTKENRIGLFVVLGVLLLMVTMVGLALFLPRGQPSHPTLIKGLKEHNGLDAKSVQLEGKSGQLQPGTVTTMQGETIPILVHYRPAGTRPAEIVWILGKQQPAAEEEIRKLVTQLGFEASSMDLHRNASGVGYVGEIAVKTGEILDVTEFVGGQPMGSSQRIALKPSSYERWVRNTLASALKEEVASVSEFKSKEKSWDEEATEAATKERARLRAEHEKMLQEIRQSGREPTLAEIALGPPLIDIQAIEAENRRATGAPRATFQAGTAAMQSGRQLLLEIELEAAQQFRNPSMQLRWKDQPK